MAFPSVYRKNSGSAIQSYDAYDAVAGTGLLNFYLGNDTYSSTPFYASPLYNSTSIPVPAGYPLYQAGITINNDRVWQKQICLRGRAIFNVPIYLSGGTSASGYITINLYNDGTLIATGNSNVISAPNATYGQTTTIVDIPSTTIKAGSTLRIQVVLYARRSQASAMTIMVGHDPMNQIDATWTSTIVKTQSIAQIPFKINI